MNPPLDTRQLRAFHQAAQTGSFTRAAEQLHLTQSAISHSIRSLEDELGCRLFFRQGKKAFLTPHGRELTTHCEAIFSRFDQARAALGALDQSPRGRLRIGTTTAAAQYILPTVLREFKESFPLYSIAVLPGETPEAVGRLQSAEIDLAVCLRPTDTSGVTCRPMFSDEVRFLVSPLHPWAHTRPRSGDLRTESFIVSSRKSYTFELVAAYFLRHNARLASPIELGSSDAIKELVKLGLGVGVMAEWTASREIAEGSLVSVPLPKGRIRREWVVAWAEGRPLTLPERTFVGLCAEVQAVLKMGSV